MVYDVFPKHIAEALMAGRKVQRLRADWNVVFERREKDWQVGSERLDGHVVPAIGLVPFVHQ